MKLLTHAKSVPTVAVVRKPRSGQFQVQVHQDNCEEGNQKMTDSLWNGIRLCIEGQYYTTKFEKRRFGANQYRRWGKVRMQLVPEITVKEG